MSTVTDIIAVTFSGGSLGVAGWAAWSAHQARVWQQQRDAERLATEVRVEFEHASQPREGPMVSFGGPTDPRPAALEYELTVTLVNHGETTEFVRDLWFREAVGPGGTEEGAHGIDLFHGDHELAPRSRMSVPVRHDHHHLDASRGFVAYGRLASGTFVESEVEQLMPDMLDHVTEHNRTARP